MSIGIKLFQKQIKITLQTDSTFLPYKEAINQIIYILKVYLKSTPNTKKISKRLNPLLSSLSKDIRMTASIILKIEDIILSLISAEILSFPNDLKILIAQSRLEARSNTIIPILSKFIQKTFMYEFGQETLPISYDIFSNWIFKFLFLIGIDSNLCVQSLIKKYLCEGMHLNFDDCTAKSTNISEFFEYFLIKENFNFLKRASIISSNIIEHICVASFGLEFKVSITKSQIPQAKVLLDVGTRFQFTNVCLDLLRINKYRDDKMILIGSHPLCDIQLPDTDADPECEPIVGVIFPCYRSWKLSDVSESPFPKISIKLQSSQRKRLKEGMLISFGRRCLLEITKIIYYEDEHNNFSSSIRFKFKKGPYVDILKEFRAFGTAEQEFIIGRGDLGLRIHLYIPEEYNLGRKHASFKYIKKKWMIEDHGSPNGTFIHIKNTFKPSKIVTLIKDKQENISPSHSLKISPIDSLNDYPNDNLNLNPNTTLNVCGYLFYIEKTQIQ